MVLKTPNLDVSTQNLVHAPMVLKTPNPDTRLIPERHPQSDLFICDVADAILKDVLPQMEHPFYSLSKKPETNIRRYEHNGHYLEVIPSVKGLATIYDKDILIYAISQLMAKLRKGEKVTKRIRVNSRDFLIFTNRGTGGKDYTALVDSVERLRGTTITTNIITGDEEQIDTFGLIESSSVRRKHGLDGRLLWVELTLSDWVFNAIEAQEVLTLHRDYFRLRKPLERRIYELARKHCGKQPEWRCSVDLLKKKSGARSEMKRFRQMLREIIEHDHLPDYSVSFDDEADKVTFMNRDALSDTPCPALLSNILDPETYHDARTVASGWDVHVLEQKWRNWMADGGMDAPRDPDQAFIGFCRKWFERYGRP